MWGGFAIFWEASVLSSSSARNSVLFPLWGVPFVLIGLYLMVGRLFMRRWTRRRTTYALTDQRVLAIAASWRGGERVTSVWLDSHPPMDKRISRDGTGTVWVGLIPTGQQRWLVNDGGWPGSRAATANAVVLSDIEDAASVYSAIARQLSPQPAG